jgi:hypothetical protein
VLEKYGVRLVEDGCIRVQASDRAETCLKDSPCVDYKECWLSKTIEIPYVDCEKGYREK